MNEEELYFKEIEDEIKKHQSCNFPIDPIWGKARSNYYQELFSISFLKSIDDFMSKDKDER